jgi:hypothetical protein
MLCDWLFAVRPQTTALDRLSYSVVLFLWVLGLGHFFSLTLV